MLIATREHLSSNSNRMSASPHQVLGCQWVSTESQLQITENAASVKRLQWWIGIVLSAPSPIRYYAISETPRSGHTDKCRYLVTVLARAPGL